MSNEQLFQAALQHSVFTQGSDNPIFDLVYYHTPHVLDQSLDFSLPDLPGFNNDPFPTLKFIITDHPTYSPPVSSESSNLPPMDDSLHTSLQSSPHTSNVPAHMMLDDVKTRNKPQKVLPGEHITHYRPNRDQIVSIFSQPVNHRLTPSTSTTQPVVGPSDTAPQPTTTATPSLNPPPFSASHIPAQIITDYTQAQIINNQVVLEKQSFQHFLTSTTQNQTNSQQFSPFFTNIHNISTESTLIDEINRQKDGFLDKFDSQSTTLDSSKSSTTKSSSSTTSQDVSHDNSSPTSPTPKHPKTQSIPASILKCFPLLPRCSHHLSVLFNQFINVSKQLHNFATFKLVKNAKPSTTPLSALEQANLPIFFSQPIRSSTTNQPTATVKASGKLDYQNVPVNTTNTLLQQYLNQTHPFSTKSPLIHVILTFIQSKLPKLSVPMQNLLVSLLQRVSSSDESRPFNSHLSSSALPTTSMSTPSAATITTTTTTTTLKDDKTPKLPTKPLISDYSLLNLVTGGKFHRYSEQRRQFTYFERILISGCDFALGDHILMDPSSAKLTPARRALMAKTRANAARAASRNTDWFINSLSRPHRVQLDNPHNGPQAYSGGKKPTFQSDYADHGQGGKGGQSDTHSAQKTFSPPPPTHDVPTTNLDDIDIDDKHTSTRGGKKRGSSDEEGPKSRPRRNQLKGKHDDGDEEYDPSESHSKDTNSTQFARHSRDKIVYQYRQGRFNSNSHWSRAMLHYRYTSGDFFLSKRGALYSHFDIPINQFEYYVDRINVIAHNSYYRNLNMVWNHVFLANFIPMGLFQGFTMLRKADDLALLYPMFPILKQLHKTLIPSKSALTQKQQQQQQQDQPQSTRRDNNVPHIYEDPQRQSNHSQDEVGAGQDLVQVRNQPQQALSIKFHQAVEKIHTSLQVPNPPTALIISDANIQLPSPPPIPSRLPSSTLNDFAVKAFGNLFCPLQSSIEHKAEFFPQVDEIETHEHQLPDGTIIFNSLRRSAIGADPILTGETLDYYIQHYLIHFYFEELIDAFEAQQMAAGNFSDVLSHWRLLPTPTNQPPTVNIVNFIQSNWDQLASDPSLELLDSADFNMIPLTHQQSTGHLNDAHSLPHKSKPLAPPTPPLHQLYQKSPYFGKLSPTSIIPNTNLLNIQDQYIEYITHPDHLIPLPQYLPYSFQQLYHAYVSKHNSSLQAQFHELKEQTDLLKDKYETYRKQLYQLHTFLLHSSSSSAGLPSIFTETTTMNDDSTSPSDKYPPISFAERFPTPQHLHEFIMSLSPHHIFPLNHQLATTLLNPPQPAVFPPPCPTQPPFQWAPRQFQLCFTSGMLFDAESASFSPIIKIPTSIGTKHITSNLAPSEGMVLHTTGTVKKLTLRLNGHAYPQTLRVPRRDYKPIVLAQQQQQQQHQHQHQQQGGGEMEKGGSFPTPSTPAPTRSTRSSKMHNDSDFSRSTSTSPSSESESMGNFSTNGEVEQLLAFAGVQPPIIYPRSLITKLQPTSNIAQNKVLLLPPSLPSPSSISISTAAADDDDDNDDNDNDQIVKVHATGYARFAQLCSDPRTDTTSFYSNSHKSKWYVQRAHPQMATADIDECPPFIFPVNQHHRDRSARPTQLIKQQQLQPIADSYHSNKDSKFELHLNPAVAFYTTFPAEFHAPPALQRLAQVYNPIYIALSAIAPQCYQQHPMLWLLSAPHRDHGRISTLDWFALDFYFLFKALITEDNQKALLKKYKVTENHIFNLRTHIPFPMHLHVPRAQAVEADDPVLYQTVTHYFHLIPPFSHKWSSSDPKVANYNRNLLLNHLAKHPFTYCPMNQFVPLPPESYAYPANIHTMSASTNPTTSIDSSDATTKGPAFVPLNTSQVLPYIRSSTPATDNNNNNNNNNNSATPLTDLAPGTNLITTPIPLEINTGPNHIIPVTIHDLYPNFTPPPYIGVSTNNTQLLNNIIGDFTLTHDHSNPDIPLTPAIRASLFSEICNSVGIHVERDQHLFDATGTPHDGDSTKLKYLIGRGGRLVLYPGQNRLIVDSRHDSVTKLAQLYNQDDGSAPNKSAKKKSTSTAQPKQEKTKPKADSDTMTGTDNVEVEKALDEETLTSTATVDAKMTTPAPAPSTTTTTTPTPAKLTGRPRRRVVRKPIADISDKELQDSESDPASKQPSKSNPTKGDAESPSATAKSTPTMNDDRDDDSRSPPVSKKTETPKKGVKSSRGKRSSASKASESTAAAVATAMEDSPNEGGDVYQGSASDDESGSDAPTHAAQTTGASGRPKIVYLKPRGPAVTKARVDSLICQFEELGRWSQKQQRVVDLLRGNPSSQLFFLEELRQFYAPHDPLTQQNAGLLKGCRKRIRKRFPDLEAPIIALAKSFASGNDAHIPTILLNFSSTVGESNSAERKSRARRGTNKSNPVANVGSSDDGGSGDEARGPSRASTTTSTSHTVSPGSTAGSTQPVQTYQPSQPLMTTSMRRAPPLPSNDPYKWFNSGSLITFDHYYSKTVPFRTFTPPPSQFPEFPAFISALQATIPSPNLRIELTSTTTTTTTTQLNVTVGSTDSPSQSPQTFSSTHTSTTTQTSRRRDQFIRFITSQMHLDRHLSLAAQQFFFSPIAEPFTNVARPMDQYHDIEGIIPYPPFTVDSFGFACDKVEVLLWEMGHNPYYLPYSSIPQHNNALLTMPRTQIALDPHPHKKNAAKPTAALTTFSMNDALDTSQPQSPSPPDSSQTSTFQDLLPYSQTAQSVSPGSSPTTTTTTTMTPHPPTSPIPRRPAIPLAQFQRLHVDFESNPHFNPFYQHELALADSRARFSEEYIEEALFEASKRWAHYNPERKKNAEEFVRYQCGLNLQDFQERAEYESNIVARYLRKGVTTSKADRVRLTAIAQVYQAIINGSFECFPKEFITQLETKTFNPVALSNELQMDLIDLHHALLATPDPNAKPSEDVGELQDDPPTATQLPTDAPAEQATQSHEQATTPPSGPVDARSVTELTDSGAVIHDVDRIQVADIVDLTASLNSEPPIAEIIRELNHVEADSSASAAIDESVVDTSLEFDPDPVLPVPLFYLRDFILELHALSGYIQDSSTYPYAFPQIHKHLLSLVPTQDESEVMTRRYIRKKDREMLGMAPDQQYIKPSKRMNQYGFNDAVASELLDFEQFLAHSGFIAQSKAVSMKEFNTLHKYLRQTHAMPKFTKRNPSMHKLDDSPAAVDMSNLHDLTRVLPSTDDAIIDQVLTTLQDLQFSPVTNSLFPPQLAHLSPFSPTNTRFNIFSNQYYTIAMMLLPVKVNELQNPSASESLSHSSSIPEQTPTQSSLVSLQTRESMNDGDSLQGQIALELKPDMENNNTLATETAQIPTTTTLVSPTTTTTTTTASTISRLPAYTTISSSEFFKLASPMLSTHLTTSLNPLPPVPFSVIPDLSTSELQDSDQAASMMESLLESAQNYPLSIITEDFVAKMPIELRLLIERECIWRLYQQYIQLHQHLLIQPLHISQLFYPSSISSMSSTSLPSVSTFSTIHPKLLLHFQHTQDLNSHQLIPQHSAFTPHASTHMSLIAASNPVLSHLYPFKSNASNLPPIQHSRLPLYSEFSHIYTISPTSQPIPSMQTFSTHKSPPQPSTNTNNIVVESYYHLHQQQRVHELSAIFQRIKGVDQYRKSLIYTFLLQRYQQHISHHFTTSPAQYQFHGQPEQLQQSLFTLHGLHNDNDNDNNKLTQAQNTQMSKIFDNKAVPSFFNAQPPSDWLLLLNQFITIFSRFESYEKLYKQQLLLLNQYFSVINRFQIEHKLSPNDVTSLQKLVNSGLSIYSHELPPPITSSQPKEKEGPADFFTQQLRAQYDAQWSQIKDPSDFASYIAEEEHDQEQTNHTNFVNQNPIVEPTQSKPKKRGSSLSNMLRIDAIGYAQAPDLDDEGDVDDENTIISRPIPQHHPGESYLPPPSILYQELLSNFHTYIYGTTILSPKTIRWLNRRLGLDRPQTGSISDSDAHSESDSTDDEDELNLDAIPDDYVLSFKDFLGLHFTTKLNQLASKSILFHEELPSAPFAISPDEINPHSLDKIISHNKLVNLNMFSIFSPQNPTTPDDNQIFKLGKVFFEPDFDHFIRHAPAGLVPPDLLKQLTDSQPNQGILPFPIDPGTAKPSDINNNPLVKTMKQTIEHPQYGLDITLAQYMARQNPFNNPTINHTLSSKDNNLVNSMLTDIHPFPSSLSSLSPFNPQPVPFGVNSVSTELTGDLDLITLHHQAPELSLPKRYWNEDDLAEYLHIRRIHFERELYTRWYQYNNPVIHLPVNRAAKIVANFQQQQSQHQHDLFLTQNVTESEMTPTRPNIDSKVKSSDASPQTTSMDDLSLQLNRSRNLDPVKIHTVMHSQLIQREQNLSVNPKSFPVLTSAALTAFQSGSLQLQPHPIDYSILNKPINAQLQPPQPKPVKQGVKLGRPPKPRPNTGISKPLANLDNTPNTSSKTKNTKNKEKYIDESPLFDPNPPPPAQPPQLPLTPSECPHVDLFDTESDDLAQDAPTSSSSTKRKYISQDDNNDVAITFPSDTPMHIHKKSRH